jgi:HEAT repeat protein
MAWPQTHDLSGNATDDVRTLVENLAVPHRAKGALRRLMAAGPAATAAVREGLRHRDPAVRIGCCKVLDHFLDDAALPELIENLDHPSAGVRRWALHALACERCKEGACRPGEDDVVPLAIRFLAGDPSSAVRYEAAGLLGPAVHKRDDALRALERARDHDPDPVVRKKARWFTPGGPRYERLAKHAR